MRGGIFAWSNGRDAEALADADVVDVADAGVCLAEGVHVPDGAEFVLCDG